MKIEKITLRNLTSIEGEQTIDFTEEPLRSAGLFAITGDMGSGKSTLLDAVCLALYNNAPRFDNLERTPSEVYKLAEEKAQQISANNVATILRRGTRQGGAEVVFSTASGERYEATWSIRTTRTGTYSSPERTLTLLSPRTERIDKADIPARIEQATGLNYEQFTRTVILAQNSFANFLRAKAADKAALLEKLTGTELYSETGKQIYRFATEADSTVKALEHEREGLLHNEMDAAALSEARERQNLLTARRTTERQTLTALSAQLSWLERFDAAVAEVKQSEADYAAKSKACMERRSDELALERYDAVRPFQPLYQEIRMRTDNIDQTKQEEMRTTANLDTVRHNLSDIAARLDVAHERTTDAEKQADVRAAVINRGYALTGEINSATEQLARLELQLTEAQAALTQREAALTAKTEAAATSAQSIRDKQLHRQTLEVHRFMFDKFDLVKDKLSLLHTETQRNKECHERREALRTRQEELRSQDNEASRKQHDFQANMDTLRSELLIHRQAIQGRDSAKLQQSAAENRERLTALRRAETLWQHISSGYATIADKEATLRREETELKHKQAAAEDEERTLAALSEAYEHVQTAFTLSRSENIVSLRKQLKEGTACPVCGATHHPYHTETERELGNLLTALAKEHDDMQKRLSDARTRYAALHEQIAADTARIEADRHALADLRARQQADVDEWQNYAYLDATFADCTATVNRDARRMTIRLLTDSATRTAQTAAKELDTYNFHQEHINRLNEQISALDDTMSRNRTALDKIHTEARIAAASMEDLQQAINLSDKACNELYSDLDEMVTLSGWFAEWQHNADGLRMRLTNLHRDWEQTCTSLDEAERSYTLLREEIRNTESALNDTRRHVVQCREARDAAREQLQARREEMQHLFGASTPAQEAEALALAIRTAREAEQQVRQQYEREQGEQNRLSGLRDHLLKSRTEEQTLLHQKQEQLDLLILRFNGSHSPVSFLELGQIFSAPTDWNSLRTALGHLREQRTLAANHLDEARRALNSLRASAERPEGEDQMPRERIEEQIRQSHDRLEEMEKDILLIDSRLLAHERCVAQAALLNKRLDAARADALEWKRLSDLFGSADGKKFRTIAQSYTFRILVSHANYHLRRLTPRYELHNIPGTLQLEIIDRDMFDEHRYVSSLSGGETFVVSLALALGLASISGAHLSIGSLFIDEGFGNLDRDSLDLVMVALSHLENTQGRKVGVISHAEQIRSQIFPQIQMRRLPGGNSSVVEIV